MTGAKWPIRSTAIVLTNFLYTSGNIIIINFIRLICKEVTL